MNLQELTQSPYGQAWKVFIPKWHPSAVNKLLGHWSKGHKLKKNDKAIVANYVQRIPDAVGKREVALKIILAPGKRACDPDAYWKSLNDALKYCRKLKDDSRQWCELMPVEFDRSTDWGTLITVRDI